MKQIKKAVALMLALGMIFIPVVNASAANQNVTVKNNVALEKSKVTLYAGESTTIKTKNNVKVKFKTNNKKVASVSSKGKVVAKKAGKATIKVSLKANSKIYKNFKVTVKKKPKTSSIKLSNKNIKIALGKKVQIKVNSVTGLSSKEVTYKSNNKKIATVTNKGLIKGIKEGTTKIVVISKVNNKVKAKVTVTVYKDDKEPVPVGEVDITPTNTPKPKATNTPKPKATNTPKPKATNTPKPKATNTPKPKATNTPKPKATNTPKPKATSTPTPIVHNYSSTYTITKQATCTEYGEKARFCTTPGHTDKTDVQKIEPLGHSGTIKETTDKFLAMAADCEVGALYYYKCDRCGEKSDKIFRYGSALGHNFTEKNTSNEYRKTEANCTEPAVYYYKCTRCEEKSTKTYTYGSALGHRYSDEYTIDIYPNYSQYGEKSRHCYGCAERTDITVVQRTTTPQYAQAVTFDRLYTDSSKENSVYNYRLQCKNAYISGVFAYRIVTKSGNSYVVKTISYNDKSFLVNIYKGNKEDDMISVNNYVTGSNRSSSKTLNFKDVFTNNNERYVWASDLISLIYSENYTDHPEIGEDIVNNIDYITDLYPNYGEGTDTIRAYIIK